MSEQGPGETPRDTSGRKAPTIDLTATEIAGAAEPNPAKSASHEPKSDEAPASSPESKDDVFARIRPIPWPAIGAGALAGGVIAAGIALASLFLTRDTKGSDLAARLARVEQQLRQPSESGSPAITDTKAVDDLTARIGKLETTVAALRQSGGDSEFANRISNLEGEVKALAENVGIAVRRSDEAASAARDASTALAQLQQKIATAMADPATMQALTNRIASLERAEKAIETAVAKQADAQSHDTVSRFAIAAGALNSALERGKPFVTELSSVKVFVSDPKQLAALDTFAGSGIPTASALAQELSELIPSLRRSSGAPAPEEGGFLERLQANAEKLVRIRSLSGAAGDDPAAIVSRLEIDASKANVSAALAELAKLPPAMRAPADPWIEKVQRRSAALEAGQQLATQSLAGLSR